MQPHRPHPSLAHRAFFERASAAPNAVAIESAAGSQTYAELARAARNVAACLAAHGAGPERVVAICIDRRLELGAAVLGVLESGAAYLPIDPSAPPARLAELVSDCGAVAVLTVAQLSAHCASVHVPVLCVDDLPAERATPLLAAAEDLAYVLYTSGSTGRPKGVEVLHGSLAVHAHGMSAHFELQSADRVLQFASLAFDVAAEELFPTWCAGATVVLRDETVAASFRAFSAFLSERRITVVNLPAGFWQEWTAELARGARELPSDLRLVIAGSERASAAALVLWKSMFGERVRWINGYGPTETTITATTFEPRGEATDANASAVPIGFPLPWVTLRVLDSERREVPRGVSGELAIGGAGVARGYRGNPGATAERFIADPFSSSTDSRLYMTGDLVRQRADGALEFLGRDDDQIKLRGYRIELGEIEAALEKLDGVSASAAMVREDSPGARALIGYVTAFAGATLDPQTTLASLAKSLPEYMLPAQLVVLQSMPRTAGGKLNRRALPAPVRAALGEAPRGATEVLLAQLWSELLGQQSLGRDDHFFRLGGHSLLAMQLVGRLFERARIEIQPRTIFEHPTLGDLAGAIDSGSTTPWPPYPPMTRVDRAQTIPLSASQEPVWFLLQLEPGLLAYNTQFSVRFAGKVDPDHLRRALALLCARHEIFRTTFHAVGESAEQRIHERYEPTVEVLDQSREPAMRTEDLCAKLCARRFDVARLPLVEWTLLKHADDDWELVQVEHHFIHDGWSIALLLGDLARFYGELHAGRDPIPTLAPVQFADYVAWQRAMLSGERLQRLRDFWRARLTGAPALLTLPTDRPRPALQTFNGASEVLTIPPALFQSLARLARREGFTPFQLLLTAFELLLARHSGLEDIVVATATANRRTPEIEGVIGMLVNPVAIRVDTSGDLSLRQLAERVRRSALESFEHQDLPFEHVVQALQPPRDFAYNPIFQVLFSFHDSPVPDLDFGAARGRMVYRYNGSAKFDMNLVVIPRGEQRVGRAQSEDDGHAIVEWEYNTDLFDRERVVRMVAHFRALLEGLEGHFDSKCASLSMLSPAELADLAACNATEAPLVPGRGLWDLFTAQAALTPEALAASFGPERLSYRELRGKAESLARELRARGVARGDLVGLNVERSLGMLVALLAIGACGAAYLPLDPALPGERLEYIVGDAFEGSARSWVISEAQLFARLPASLGQGALDLGELSVAAARNNSLDPLEPARGDELAYAIYTSGSTGRPKGVELTQDNLVNFLDSMVRRLGPKQGDVLVAVTTLSFDIAGLELYLPLCSGAAVVIASREQASDALALNTLLTGARATFLQATPATWRMLIESDWRGADSLVALCGGEALPLDLALGIASRTRRLFNLYGPTETTIWSSIDEIPRNARDITIGRPLDNTQLYVLGKQRERLPRGSIGELWIGGAGVARGYRRREELTRERFVPDPYTSAPGARLYRTGDLARLRPDGRVEYLGRIDNQVKLRGFRIELGEIEAAVRAHPRVADAAVDLREFAPGDQRLMAWYVARGHSEVDEADLRECVARQLPEYMLPAAYGRLDALPTTPNGKLDRKALPAVGTAARQGEFVAPVGDVECAVAEIWREVLSIEAVGAHDRFFDLGGHSLLALRAITRMEQRFGVRVPARDLMLQNLTQVCAALGERRAAAPVVQNDPKGKAAGGGLLGALRGLLGRPPTQ